MRTKNIATVSAVVFGLTAALMGGTALSQTTPAPADDPLLQQDQTQAAPDTGIEQDPLAPDTGIAEDADPLAPDTGVAEEADPLAPDTGIAEDADPLAPEADTGIAADTTRPSVGTSGEPYAGDVLAGITADEIMGMTVIDANGDNVGSVNDLLFGDGGQVDQAIISVGGFLGFGAKSVAIPLADLTVAEGDGEVVLNVTREQLDAMPEWTRADEGWTTGPMDDGFAPPPVE